MFGKMIENPGRREFLARSITGTAGLTLGLMLPASAKANPTEEMTDTAMFEEGDFIPNAFLKIGEDNRIQVLIKHLEMGQGTYTGLTTIIADELDAAWEQMVPIAAPADSKRYNNTFWGPSQGTGGSTGIANSYAQLRNAGAAAKQMMIEAAAKKWQVPTSEINVKQGVIQHLSSEKSVSFGEIAKLASQEAVPAKPRLKSSEEFIYIGKDVSRKDFGKTDGTAIFTQDVKLPNMLTAVVAHSPRFGGKAKSFDASKTLKSPGVVKVLQIPQGIAVLAKDFWSAKLGRDLLSVEWDNSKALASNSQEILAEYKQLATQTGPVAASQGDFETAMSGAKYKVELDYEFPYLAHATMEPMNCVVTVTDSGVEIQNGAQLVTGDQFAVAAVCGVKPEQVSINTLYAGGSFGRRANPHSDYVVEAAEIAKQAGKNIPVKLVWTREDDTRAGYFRPMYVHRLKAGIDDKGNIVSWHHRIVGQSIIKGTAFEMLIQNGIDTTSVEGATELPYNISNMQIELHSPDTGVPVQWWRSVGSTHTAFSTETMIDELAHLTNQDPYDYRLSLIKDHPRELNVLKVVATKAGWRKVAGNKQAKGIALHKSFGSYVAQVAEVSENQDGSIRIDRIVCAVDCGVAVNPDIIKAQIEGGIGYGLSPTLMSEINIENGMVKESNFHDYQVLRMDKMPEIEVHIVESRENPTGVGEPGTPVVAPAVANAIFALTKKRITRLPMRDKIKV